MKRSASGKIEPAHHFLLEMGLSLHELGAATLVNIWLGRDPPPPTKTKGLFGTKAFEPHWSDFSQ